MNQKVIEECIKVMLLVEPKLTLKQINKISEKLKEIKCNLS